MFSIMHSIVGVEEILHLRMVHGERNQNINEALELNTKLYENITKNGRLPIIRK